MYYYENIDFQLSEDGKCPQMSGTYDTLVTRCRIIYCIRGLIENNTDSKMM